VDKLGNILPAVLRRQPGGGRMLGSRVAAEFRAIIGPEPARLCEEVELKSGVLIITTSSPALAHQLRLDAETVVKRLNDLDLGRRVRSLRVRIGRPTLG
jgi:Dna[CI] antecedent, DciA